jgi:hypothetical protein
VTMRAPNSTPMVRSWTGWNLLSVNFKSRYDFPTPKLKSAIHFSKIKNKRKRKNRKARREGSLNAPPRNAYSTPHSLTFH